MGCLRTVADELDAPWLLSMHPMTCAEGGDSGDDGLYRSDTGLPAPALKRYADQRTSRALHHCLCAARASRARTAPSILGIHGRTRWVLGFADILTRGARQGGNLNLAGVLFSDKNWPWSSIRPALNPFEGSREIIPADDVALETADTKTRRTKLRNMSAEQVGLWIAPPGTRKRAHSCAPFGPGQERRNSQRWYSVLAGGGKNLVCRTLSLSPGPHGRGIRKPTAPSRLFRTDSAI